MSPLQLRIGSLVARPDESEGSARVSRPGRRVRREEHEGSSEPEIAYVRDNLIVVSPWNRRRP